MIETKVSKTGEDELLIHKEDGAGGFINLIIDAEGDIEIMHIKSNRAKTWSKIDISGPKGRFGHTLKYDKKSGKIYLFGGHDGKNLLNDFWMFDENQWIEIDSKDKPSPRMAHAMEFDNNGIAILYGGWKNTNTVSNELWRWKEGKWTFINMKTKPQARLSHAIGFDQSNNEFVLFGGSTGFNGEFLNETWKFKIKN